MVFLTSQQNITELQSPRDLNIVENSGCTTLMMVTCGADLGPLSSTEDVMLKGELRKKTDVTSLWDTTTLTTEEREYVLKNLTDIPKELVYETAPKQLCFDSVSTTHATGFREDSIEESMVELNPPVYMSGISGGIPATHRGIVHYELISDSGDKEVIEDQAYYMPELGCRLFSPQYYLKSLGMDLEDPNQVYMKVYHDRETFRLKSGNEITVNYHPRNNIPILPVY